MRARARRSASGPFASRSPARSRPYEHTQRERVAQPGEDVLARRDAQRGTWALTRRKKNSRSSITTGDLAHDAPAGVMGFTARDPEARERLRQHGCIGVRAVPVEMAHGLGDMSAALDGARVPKG
jgi:hypothetical protein